MSKVIIGVDPHKLSATIEVVDTHERLLGARRFATDQAGYTAMRTYAKSWPERVWAIEATGAGRPLAQRLGNFTRRSAVVGLWNTDRVSMNKQQKLRNIAEGFLAGLAAVGFQGPWRWAHHEWEGAFYRAWRQWSPSSNGDAFRAFRVGGSADGRTSQARDILFTVKSTSPFYGYDRTRINPKPMGLTPEEYLDIWVEGASPQEWMALATTFLAEMVARRS